MSGGPITAWRYWWVLPPVDKTWVFGDVECHLRGDFQVWDGPLKVAGKHDAGDPFAAIFWASTIYRSLSPHDSPHVGCLCGVNAVKRLRVRDVNDRLVSSPPPSTLLWLSPPPAEFGLAFGQVELGGKVDEYEEGYRAEQALIAGPIYVVAPPEHDPATDWRSALERRYGQPVIEQSPEEALDWIRKDEEANGYWQAHQDTRVGAAGASLTRGTITVPIVVNTAAFQAALTAASAAASAAADDFARAFRTAARARARRRARARLTKTALVAIKTVQKAAELVGWVIAAGWLFDFVNFRWVP